MAKMLTDNKVQVQAGGSIRFRASASDDWSYITPSSNKSAKTCVELGWSQPVPPHIASTSDDATDCGAVVDITGTYSNNNASACSQGAITWVQARNACNNIGARLATKTEALVDSFAGTGCNHDARMIWTSTPGSTSGTYWLVGGDGTDGHAQERAWNDVDFASNPLPSSTNDIGIRCVADN
jgi:hypothetical protein